MANPTRSSVFLEAEAEEAPRREVDSDTPFRILILSDLSGRANRKSKRRPIPIDLDNFDEVMNQMQPGLRLPHTDLRFRELDDFHPDHIYRHAEVFQKLAELRYQPPRAAATAAPVPANLLESILEQTPEPRSEDPGGAPGDLADFIRRVTAPHLEDRPDAAKAAFAARVQAAAADEMRAILHHPEFQALEAAWRATWMLVQGLADDVRIYILDTTLDELLSDPAALAGHWTLLVGNYVFGETEADARRLHTLGRLARAAGAPFLAEAQPPSGETPPEAWQQLRRSPEAQWIGLALPRFLLRLPYGKATSPVETFPFEEMSGSVHAEYLWGNPAFCCALLIGQSFRSHGWDLRPGMHRRMDGLPLHAYKSGGESVTKPCAEILLSEKDADLLLDLGYIPLASMKDMDAVMVVRFQSIGGTAFRFQ